MGFAKEKDMLKTVEAWLYERTDFIAAEFGCGYCNRYVADIVGMACDVNAVRRMKRTAPMGRGRIKKLLANGGMYLNNIKNLIAVELKLDNFPQAYFQAKMYSQFGFRSYIAMPRGTWDRVGHIRREVMKNDGLGFIEVGEKCEVQIEAKHRVLYSVEDKIQISERLIMRFKESMKGE